MADPRDTIKTLLEGAGLRVGTHGQPDTFPSIILTIEGPTTPLTERAINIDVLIIGHPLTDDDPWEGMADYIIQTMDALWGHASFVAGASAQWLPPQGDIPHPASTLTITATPT